MESEKAQVIEYLDHLKELLGRDDVEIIVSPKMVVEDQIRDYPEDHEAQMKTLHRLRYRSGQTSYALQIELVAPVIEADRVKGLAYAGSGQ